MDTIPLNVNQESLRAKCLKMVNAVAEVSKLKNFMGPKPTNLRQFKNFLSVLEYDYGDFLHFTEVCYLCRRERLKNVNDMRREI
jgi:hypothetical protein